jgi:hypothetical protein
MIGGDEAGDIVAPGADIGQQAVIERVQLADGDAAQAPVGEFAGQGFEHLSSPWIGQSGADAETGGFGFSGLAVLALRGSTSVALPGLTLLNLQRFRYSRDCNELCRNEKWISVGMTYGCSWTWRGWVG